MLQSVPRCLHWYQSGPLTHAVGPCTVSQLARPLLKAGATSEKMAKIMEGGLHENHMERRYSSIINIGSASSTIPDKTGSIYAASKAAMDMLTRNLACEWAPDRIRVNCVSPWYIGTPLALQVGPIASGLLPCSSVRHFSDVGWEMQVLKDEAFKKTVLARTPLARVGDVE